MGVVKIGAYLLISDIEISVNQSLVEKQCLVVTAKLSGSIKKQ